MFRKEPSYLEKLESHIDILRPYFEKIQIKSQGDVASADEMEIETPDFPDGYEVFLIRRSVKNTFHTDGDKSLQISEITVFKDHFHLDVPSKCGSEGSGVKHSISISCESDAIREMLKRQECKPRTLVNEIEELLLFSNAIKEYIK